MDRYATLCNEHDELVQALEEARDGLYSAIGTRKEADAQGEYARADAALSAWLDSDDGIEWSRLDAQAKGTAV